MFCYGMNEITEINVNTTFSRSMSKHYSVLNDLHILINNYIIALNSAMNMSKRYTKPKFVHHFQVFINFCILIL